MVSIHTNAGAIAALQTLKSIGSSLADTQLEASSGLRIRGAEDNAAYWSISITMRSENNVNAVVTDSIALAQAIVDVAYPAAEIVLNALVEVRALAIQVQNLDYPFPSGITIAAPGVDGKRVIDNYDANWQTTYAGTTLMALDTAAAQQLDMARSAMASASFNGVNLLVKPDNGKSLAENLASFVVGHNQGAIQTLDLAASDYVLLNEGRSVGDVSEDGHLDGLTSYMVPDGSGGMVKTWYGNWTMFTARQGVSYNDVRSAGILFDLAIGMPNQQGLGLNKEQAYDVWMTNLSKQIDKVTTVMSRLGAVKDSLSRYEELNADKMDTVENGIGRLVDADMNEVSTRLKALETQQQLGMQALQIANTSADQILQLFR